jgi:general stress protein YciG
MSKRKKKMSKAEAGRIGGRTTKKRHGIEHYRQAGKKGFQATVSRHWNGDKAGYIRYLQSLGVWAEWERGFASLEPGESGIVCREIPPLPGDDEDPAEDDLADWLVPFEQLRRRILSAPVPAYGGF